MWLRNQQHWAHWRSSELLKLWSFFSCVVLDLCFNEIPQVSSETCTSREVELWIWGNFVVLFMYVTAMTEESCMDLKQSKDSYMRGLGGRNQEGREPGRK